MTRWYVCVGVVCGLGCSGNGPPSVLFDAGRVDSQATPDGGDAFLSPSELFMELPAGLESACSCASSEAAATANCDSVVGADDASWRCAANAYAPIENQAWLLCTQRRLVDLEACLAATTCDASTATDYCLGQFFSRWESCTPPDEASQDAANLCFEGAKP